MCKDVQNGLRLKSKDWEIVIHGLIRLMYLRLWLLCTLIIGFIQGVNGTKNKHFMW